MDFYSKAGGPWTNYFEENKDRKVLAYGTWTVLLVYVGEFQCLCDLNWLVESVNWINVPLLPSV
jgi:hypothetical protein